MSTEEDTKRQLIKDNIRNFVSKTTSLDIDIEALKNFQKKYNLSEETTIIILNMMNTYIQLNIIGRMSEVFSLEDIVEIDQIAMRERLDDNERNALIDIGLTDEGQPRLEEIERQARREFITLIEKNTELMMKLFERLKDVKDVEEAFRLMEEFLEQEELYNI